MAGMMSSSATTFSAVGVDTKNNAWHRRGNTCGVSNHAATATSRNCKLRTFIAVKLRMWSTVLRGEAT